ncbi:MAG: DUF2599 domain-containing protein [Actinomycetales bacterium]|nr:DUF2599 domain-containing protein [Actinomycetales bacterium]
MLGVFPSYSSSDEDLKVLSVMEQHSTTSNEIEYQVLNNTVDLESSLDEDSVIDVEINGVGLTVESDSETTIEFRPAKESSPSFDLTIDYLKDDAHPVILSNGLVEFEAEDPDIRAYAAVKDDGSVQVVTAITSPDAPEEYLYSLEIPAGGEIVELGDSLAILDENEEFIGAVAPAWAIDANGVPVPTEYVVDGTSVTQVVEHQAHDVAYPVVADPWLGVNLLAGTWVNRKGPHPDYGTVYSTKLSSWGWTVYAGSTSGPLLLVGGQKILRDAGWKEFKARRQKVNTKTMHQQYLCHVQYGYAIWAAGVHWDLESKRSVKNNWATTNPLSHKCNWK